MTTFSELTTELRENLEASIVQDAESGRSFAQLLRLLQQLAAIRQASGGGSGSGGGTGYGGEIDFTPVIAKLEQIRTHVDGIEPTIGNLTINSEALNLNTDGVEAKLDQLIGELETLLSVAGTTDGSVSTISTRLTTSNQLLTETRDRLDILPTIETDLADSLARLVQIYGAVSGVDGGFSGLSALLTALKLRLETATSGGYVKPATGATFPVSMTSLPLPAGAATESTLNLLLSAANAISSNTASTRYDFQLAEDSNGVFIYRYDYQSGSVTPLTLALAPYTPSGTITITPPDVGKAVESKSFEAITTNNPYWIVGHALRRVDVINTATRQIEGSVWLNDATGVTLSTTLPAIGVDCKEAGDVSLDELRNIQAILNTSNTSIGVPGDAAWVSGAGTLVALLKNVAGHLKRSNSPVVNGFIAAGGTAQTAIAANPTRNYIEIINNSAAVLWVQFGSAAGVDAGLSILPGKSWYSPSKWCPTGAVSIFGATTGQKYAIVEG